MPLSEQNSPVEKLQGLAQKFETRIQSIEEKLNKPVKACKKSTDTQVFKGKIFLSGYEEVLDVKVEHENKSIMLGKVFIVQKGLNYHLDVKLDDWYKKFSFRSKTSKDTKLSSKEHRDFEKKLAPEILQLAENFLKANPQILDRVAFKAKKQNLAKAREECQKAIEDVDIANKKAAKLFELLQKK